MRRLMNPLIQEFMLLALASIEKLPAAQRADHYEAAAILLQLYCKEQSAAAMDAANSLRAAESQQLLFRNLITEGRDA